MSNRRWSEAFNRVAVILVSSAVHEYLHDEDVLWWYLKGHSTYSDIKISLQPVKTVIKCFFFLALKELFLNLSLINPPQILSKRRTKSLEWLNCNHCDRGGSHQIECQLADICLAISSLILEFSNHLCPNLKAQRTRSCKILQYVKVRNLESNDSMCQIQQTNTPPPPKKKPLDVGGVSNTQAPHRTDRQ